MSSPIHQFVIERIVPIEIAGYDLSFTNSSLWMSIAAGLSIIFLTLSMNKKAWFPIVCK